MESINIKWTHLEEVLNEFADQVIQKARENLAANGTNATNNLSDTIEKIVEIGDDTYSVKLSLADYWRYVEEGTGPGHIPDARAQYYPKIQPLKEWVSVKPGVPKDDSFAYAVRGKIHASGTTAQPFLEPAKEEVLARFELLINQAIEQDVSDYIEELVETKLKDALA
jgi:HK97 gp10 family phage protein